jgi:hypothetical protein
LRAEHQQRQPAIQILPARHLAKVHRTSLRMQIELVVVARMIHFLFLTKGAKEQRAAVSNEAKLCGLCSPSRLCVKK